MMRSESRIARSQEERICASPNRDQLQATSHFNCHRNRFLELPIPSHSKHHQNHPLRCIYHRLNINDGVHKFERPYLPLEKSNSGQSSATRIHLSSSHLTRKKHTLLDLVLAVTDLQVPCGSNASARSLTDRCRVGVALCLWGTDAAAKRSPYQSAFMLGPHSLLTSLYQCTSCFDRASSPPTSCRSH